MVYFLYLDEAVQTCLCNATVTKSHHRQDDASGVNPTACSVGLTTAESLLLIVWDLMVTRWMCIPAASEQPDPHNQTRDPALMHPTEQATVFTTSPSSCCCTGLLLGLLTRYAVMLQVQD